MKFLLDRWWVFRILSVAALILIAFRPVVVRPNSAQAGSWAVLLDTSASMKTKDPSSRFENAKRLAKDLSKFAEDEIYSFDASVEKIEPGSLEKLQPLGRKTDLASGLRSVFEKKPFRGAIVLTDGRQVGGADVLSAAGALGKPLVLVGFGDNALFKDVAVKSIQSPPFSFKNISMSLAATVSASGYDEKIVSVRLRQGERVVSMQTLPVHGNEMEASVAFQWTPTTLGAQTLSVEVVPLAGEITTANNQKNVSIDVGRDRFRVLYICGEPGPEYGFLRHQFKSDPAVELVTFVILRNNQNVLSVPENELSLIPFPTQDVLINQLATFDLVVFEEFVYSNFGLLPSVVMAIRQKVQDGGSFLLMGGAHTFGLGSPYGITGIQDMIPVPVGASETLTEPGPLAFQLNAPAHPIVKLESNIEKNQEIWAKLPLLDGVTLVPKEKAGSTVLLSAIKNGKEHPVLTVWKFGKGRVAAFTARTTWRWSMQKGHPESSSDVYAQFWKNMVLWLTHSDKYKPLRLSMDKKEIPLGEASTLRIWVYDEYFKPVADADVRLQMTSPDGQKMPLVAHEETSGVYAVMINAEQLGAYQVDAWASRKSKSVGEERIRFRVVEGTSEEDDLRPDFATLRELATVSNGRSLRFDEFSVKLMDEFNEELERKGGRKILVWNSPWLFIWVVMFLVLEWFVRKKRGLP